MDEPSLQGVDLKISRAKSHLSDLERTIKGAFDSERYQFRFEYDAKATKHPLWVDPFPLIPPEWSVIIGEILFNLRSALDHLAYQLVILDKGTPTDQTKFPVRESPFDIKGKPISINSQLPIKDPKILAALEECQPYTGPDGEIYPPDENFLWLLHRLNIIDKHRLLLVAICVLDISQMWWDSPDDPAPCVSVIDNAPIKE